MQSSISSRARGRAGRIAVFACFITGAASAQTSPADKAAAEALFQQGLELMRVGKLAEACDRLEQSSAIERGIGTTLYLAECYEKSGRTASAWGLFREASSEAQARGESERAAAGKRRADRLEPLLSRLTVNVQGAVPGLEVLRDGAQVPAAVWNVAVPVDPGQHKVTARAPGYVDWSSTVSVDAGGATASLVIPPLTPSPQAEAAAAPALPARAPSATAAPGAAAPAPADAGTVSGTSHPGATQRTLGLVVGGVGLVVAGVGGYFGIRAIGKNDDAGKYCPGGGAACNDERGLSLTTDAKDAATVANVLVIGGAVLAAGGAVLYFTAPSERAGHVGFTTDGRGARVTLGGAF